MGEVVVGEGDGDGDGERDGESDGDGDGEGNGVEEEDVAESDAEEETWDDAVTMIVLIVDKVLEEIVVILLLLLPADEVPTGSGAEDAEDVLDSANVEVELATIEEEDSAIDDAVEEVALDDTTAGSQTFSNRTVLMSAGRVPPVKALY